MLVSIKFSDVAPNQTIKDIDGILNLALLGPPAWPVKNHQMWIIDKI